MKKQKEEDSKNARSLLASLPTDFTFTKPNLKFYLIFENHVNSMET